MKVIVLKTPNEVCETASEIIKDVVNTKNNACLGLATGGSAEQVYDGLEKFYKNGEVDFSKCHSINLDEYIGLSPDHPQSYRYYMNQRFFDRVNIDKKNTYVPIGNINPEEEVLKFRSVIDSYNGADVQLLGVGRNGHIAFNEPSENLSAVAHIVNLQEDTIKANSIYFDKIEDVPTRAISMGMGEILRAKKIVLVAFGKSKKYGIGALINENNINTNIPCTLLKCHRDVTVIIDEELANAIEYK